MLVIALWIVILLSIAAVALSRYLATETRLMRYHLAHAQVQAWARAGVYLAMERLAVDANTPESSNPDKFYDWLGDDWAYLSQGSLPSDPTTWVVPLPVDLQNPTLPGSQVNIQVTDEERKLDLNTAVDPPLTNLLQNAQAVQAIIDYRDPDSDGPHEGDLTLQPPYVPKNGPFTTLEELWDLPPVSADAAVVQQCDQETTVSLSQGTVNINTVSAAVLKALVNDTTLDALIDTFMTSRPGVDGIFGTDDDCKATNKDSGTAAQELANCTTAGDPAPWVTLLSKSTLSFDVSSSVFRIVAVGQNQQPSIQYRIEAIVLRGITGNGGPAGHTVQVSGQPFQLLAWKEG